MKKSLSQELKEVTTMSPKDLIKYCYDHGITNARIYEYDMLLELAVSLVLEQRR